MLFEFCVEALNWIKLGINHVEKAKHEQLLLALVSFTQTETCRQINVPVLFLQR